VRSRVFVDAAVLIALCVAETWGAESTVAKQTQLPTMYNATALYYQKDLKASYQMFLQVVSKAAAETNRVEGLQAEWWLGLIEERWGNLESAYEHFERGLMLLTETPLGHGPEKLALLLNVTRACEQQGKVGCALASNTEGSQLLDVFWNELQEKKAQDGTNYHRFALDYSTFITSRFVGDAMGQRARWLQRAGQFEVAEEGLKRVIAEIDMQWKERVAEYHGYPPANNLPNAVPWQDQDLQTLWWELGKQYAFLERLDEAVGLGARIEAVPPEHRYFELGWLQVIDYAGMVGPAGGRQPTCLAFVERGNEGV
jgi:tetratricopeptide (TPR) repeat protein